MPCRLGRGGFRSWSFELNVSFVRFGRRTEMARRTFTMVDVAEILEHWYAGRAKVEVARSLGVDAKTVRRYVAAAEAAGLVPGGPPVSGEQWRAMIRQWFPELADTRLRQPS